MLGHIVLALSLRIDWRLPGPTSYLIPPWSQTLKKRIKSTGKSIKLRDLPDPCVKMFGDNSWIPISIPVYVSPRGSIAKTKLESYVFTFHRFDRWNLDGLRELSIFFLKECVYLGKGRNRKIWKFHFRHTILTVFCTSTEYVQVAYLGRRLYYTLPRARYKRHDIAGPGSFEA